MNFLRNPYGLKKLGCFSNLVSIIYGMNTLLRIFACLALCPAFSLLAKKPTVGEKLFALKVKPLLARKCMACHGDDPKKIKGDFDMRTRESMLRGGGTYEEEVLKRMESPTSTELQF